MRISKKITASVAAMVLLASVAAMTASAVTEDTTPAEYVFATGKAYNCLPADRQSEDLGLGDASADGMTLVSETESVEDGIRIVDRLYVNEITTYSASSTKVQEVKKERTIYDTGTNVGEPYITMYVKGIFESNGSTAYVNEAAHWHGETEKGKGKYVRDKSYKYDSDVGGFIGHKYAYIEYIATIKLANGTQRDFRLWVDVDSTGAVHVDG